MRNFTPEDLLEFHYNELPADQAKEMADELQNNWALREKLAVIREAAQRLDKSMEKPRKEVVSAILKYAAKQKKAVVS